MGLIVDDNGRGIHGELRRESFSVFSDFAKEWDIELDLEKLDEFFLVVRRLKDARDSGKHYAQHRRFAKRKELAPRRARELAALEGAARIVHMMEVWGQTISPALRQELKELLDDVKRSDEMHFVIRREWTKSRLERDFDRIRIETLLQARDLVCPRCRCGDRPHHGCRAFPIRIMIARIDPGMARITPKDWMPAPKT